jgi:hypothetical protein
LLVLLLEECSLELPLGELSLDDDEWCSVAVVEGASTTAGAATTIGGGGATTTGATYATAGAGADVVVDVFEFELVDSVCANPTATVPNSIATPKDIAAVLKECFTILSPFDLQMTRSINSKVALIERTMTCRLLDRGLSAAGNLGRPRVRAALETESH